MGDYMQDGMAEATRLTREGRLAEATAVIQRTLGGTFVPVSPPVPPTISPPRSPPCATEGRTVHLESPLPGSPSGPCRRSCSTGIVTRPFTRATRTTSSRTGSPPVIETPRTDRCPRPRSIRDRCAAGTPTPASPTATPEIRSSWSGGTSMGSGTPGQAGAFPARTSTPRDRMLRQRWRGFSSSTRGRVLMERPSRGSLRLPRAEDRPSGPIAWRAIAGQVGRGGASGPA